MPIFEYQCPDCRRIHERFHHALVDSSVCPNCAGDAVRIQSVTVVGQVGVKKVAERVDARMKSNAARGKRSSNV